MEGGVEEGMGEFERSNCGTASATTEGLFDLLLECFFICFDLFDFFFDLLDFLDRLFLLLLLRRFRPRERGLRDDEG